MGRYRTDGISRIKCNTTCMRLAGEDQLPMIRSDHFLPRHPPALLNRPFPKRHVSCLCGRTCAAQYPGACFTNFRAQSRHVDLPPSRVPRQSSTLVPPPKKVAAGRRRELACRRADTTFLRADAIEVGRTGLNVQSFSFHSKSLKLERLPQITHISPFTVQTRKSTLALHVYYSSAV